MIFMNLGAGLPPVGICSFDSMASIDSKFGYFWIGLFLFMVVSVVVYVFNLVLKSIEDRTVEDFYKINPKSKKIQTL